MDGFLLILRTCFLFFAAYTLIYTLQWLAALVVSIERLSHFEENREVGRRILDDPLARKTPVTVIIPAYNEESCICDTVSALLKEDYPELEIMVVSDGSTDHTVDNLLEKFPMEPICLKPGPEAIKTQPVTACYGARIGDKELRLLCKESGGKGDALNCGFGCSQADYCVAVDADTKVRPGSIRMMAGKFLGDSRTVVCAGAVGTRMRGRKRLSLLRKLLVQFQRIEYYRTFYMHRLLFDSINANIIVSGAFAMFDRKLVLQAGGYKLNTIGEDMELTMRLHAFCLSQHRDYRIAYIPEARCDTQVPFRYRDYFRQRRRWHIGLTQSLRQHLYMIGHRSYGAVGTLAVIFVLIYEFLAPFIELLGVTVLALSLAGGILDLKSAGGILLCYMVLALMTQSLLLSALRAYGVEKIGFFDHIRLILVSSTEWVFFHPINMIIKLVTFLTYRRYRQTWSHVRRIHENAGTH